MGNSVDKAEDVLDQIDRTLDEEAVSETDEVSVGEFLDAFGARSFAPIFIITGLVVVSPLGGIPGIPTTMAVISAAAALQLVIGRTRIWMPAVIERRTIKASHARKIDEKARPVARFTDRHTRERWTVLISPWTARMAGTIIILLCLTVPPLEMVPFAGAIAMGSVAILGLALLVRDGLVMGAALLASALAIGISVRFLLNVL